MHELPLSGIRILDMATVLAAPFAATLCADMGADVVKLELPNGNDTLRGLAPVFQGHPLFWKTANRGKKGISLDVRKPAGRDLFLKLIADFDVLVENFRTGTLDGWGLDIATLHRHNPRLVVLRLTGFGQNGPYARRPGFARIFEAMSGFANLTGERDGPPQHMNFPLGDAISGLFGAFSIATALVERNAKPRNEQRGVEIDLAATEAMMRLLDPLAAEYVVAGVDRMRSGSRATYTAPSNVYRSADGAWITLVGSGDVTFKRVCVAMDRPDLVDDDRFSSSVNRTANLEALDQLIDTWCVGQTFEQLSKRLQNAQVPFSKVYTTADLVNDPHFRERKAFIELQDPDVGSIPAPAPVPRFIGRLARIPSVGPATGQHNEQVYGSVGVSKEELSDLKASGVI
ncbi:CaiB/BaiF CoA transferase family protein [Pseudorhodoferax soli]|uniref:Crotonobetainyl-CoA:carnitine CoA-transferase CaiB-like acyl-CoA transferase n=1 Tax=Pseudorhodoferax soli TaxID=545864 RepID=A0A368XC73_9BURK|nr:CoA transferase [Pseudorhodoferax soli]RCW63624.1 crotonobetainyl-CoA:carnitine CoA-transferase CaiB-like acyl-CoA transferase [Pseudorhodoferax soli]